ncbi:DNA mismatch repair protein MutS, partial [bacterium]|nr:DNA mismatch repair protein MutS [bacterium]
MLKESLAALPQLRATLGGSAPAATDDSVHDAAGPYHASPRAPRVPWGDFPEVIVSGDLQVAKTHPDYPAAKAGDADAAYRFVRAILEEEAVAVLRRLVAGRRPVLVAAHAVEAEGRRNAIPEMYAKVLADRLGLPVDDEIVQSNVVQHTGAGAFHRIAYQPVFEGAIESGQDFLLVDDNVAVGGTLANLRGYIETHGGRVIGATTLTESGPSGRVAVRPETLQALRAKHGDDLETWWRKQFGHGLDCLTESEARHLLKAPDVDAIRGRVAAARQAADPPPGGRADRLREAGEVAPAAKPELGPAFIQPSASPALLRQLLGQLTEQPELQDLIGRAIVDAPPADLKDGGLIRSGFHAELDVLHRASTEGKEWIAALQQQEIERTGITSLKVRYNQVFGYYIEVTKSNLAKVPADYIRKQTIAGGERYITPELKEMEGKILGAEEKAAALEYELFLQVRGAVAAVSATIQATAGALAALDVLAGLAELARHQNWCRPEVTNDARLEIVDGRHPVLEQTLVEERFVPNDALLDDQENQVLIITGPNMAGKSTYIRQVALLVLLAQTGSYIPAARASIGAVDRIFTRVGATDDLARGQSTFLVEMNETANILNNATGSSLIILDEIGRGTSTFDGLSIAWAVAEHLHNEVGAKTLFATHYHELTELAVTLPRVKNLNVAVREWHDQVVFLHKILPGGTDKSYGIQVARLAGLPKTVIARAK